MKVMNPVFFWANLALFFSVVLHGCDFGEPEPEPQEVTEQEQELPKPPAPSPSRKPHKRKTAAKCNGGHFSCDGGWREWCGRMKKQCKAKDCAPMCAWTCDSPQCNQECGPVCNQPVCSTRCKGFNTDSCKMKCGKPMCKVVCPKHFCPSEDCAACKTECGKPACKMECGVDEQPCRHVCAQPVCKWECKNPQLCPKPKCAMKCKKAPDCMQKTHMFSKVPPLEPGETEIVTLESSGPAPAPAPASFLQGLVSASKASTLRVNFTSMGSDQIVHHGQVDLALEQVDANDDTADSWAREVIESHEQVTENAAFCTNGSFQCQGEEAFCAEQEKLICKGSQAVLFNQRSRAQSHLKA